MTRIHSIVTALAVATVAFSAAAASPDAAGQSAGIKALSAAEQASLLDGQGMGFAKAAELNGYPGPKHVLELSAQLSLSETQRAATQALFERMRTAARAEGQALVEAERALDGLYAQKSATAASVNAQLAKIEASRARLRGIHLNAHLDQAALLNPHQIALYAQLRGHGGQHH